MNLVILHTVPIFLLISSCNHKESPHGLEPDTGLKTEVISLPSGEGDTLKASFFADTVEYIPLETTPDTYIGGIRQLWLDDSIILVSQQKPALLLMFSRSGKFLRHIGTLGRGPGEYNTILNFDVIKDTIYISALKRRVIVKYALDGSFCGETQLKSPIGYMNSTLDGHFTYYNYEKGTILTCNNEINDADTIPIEYDITEGRYLYMIYNPTFMRYFQKTSSGLFYTDYLSDTIWNISKNAKQPEFILKTDENLLPRDKHIQYSGGDFNRWGTMANEYKQFHVIPLSAHLFVFQKRWYTGEYDAIYHASRKAGDFKKYSPFIYEDMVGEMTFNYIYFTTYMRDMLVTEVGATEIYEHLHSDKSDTQRKPTKEWVNQMSTIKEDDNPILVIMKINKHE